MYPITRESVMVVINSSVAEKAVCWCDGRKKRNRRILRRLTHLAGGGRVIGGAESGTAIGFGNKEWGILVGVIGLFTVHKAFRYIPPSFTEVMTNAPCLQS